jgi:phosphoribosylformylglycinamidine synthase
MPTVHRFEVRVKPTIADTRAAAAIRRAKELGFPLSGAATAKVYLIEGELSQPQLTAVSAALLADPVTEEVRVGSAPNAPGTTLVEVHPLPGVMDPAAQSVQEAIRDLTGVATSVSTGSRFDLQGIRTADDAKALASRALANPAIHSVVTAPFHPTSLPHGSPYTLRLVHVPIRDLTDDQLRHLSKQGHLFLALAEMQAIQAHYRSLRRDPTDIELETLAQTWSEHCVHKTLKATVHYTCSAPGPSLFATTHPGLTTHADGSFTIDNLLKRTVALATHELIAEGLDWTLSVFKDNSGVIALDDQWAVNIKVETHNRPSAIEPYGGAATGIGGCIRDVIGTGLGAKPIASTDVFCVAHPAQAAPLPPGVLPPRRVLTDVVAGVRDYGNRMGIPTVSGGVFFDDRYVGNPLVFCGCIGLLPRALVKGTPRAGDRIIALGGRTGRDGIHGATFSSAELQSTSASEFSHAVQIGNAIEEKRVLDCILRARSAGPGGTPLYTAMTDCGAGGFSSAVGEMASQLGASVELSSAPVKYAGLSYTEIWISEAQERMVLSVPQEHVAALRAIAQQEGTLLADLGEFGTPDKSIRLHYQGTLVGELSCDFLHEGLPNPTREATWPAQPQPVAQAASQSASHESIAPTLLALLAHPTIASKHWIIRQYDHEVQGATVVKPLVGPRGVGPASAAVLQPIPASHRGIAISQGLQTSVGDARLGGDPYWMVLASIDECVRNLVCAGADPARIAILDNFCWPSCDKPSNMGALVRASAACYHGAKAFRTPFVSGKDSLSNQLRYTDPATGEARLIEIPFTLLVTGLAIVPDVRRALTTDAKQPGNHLVLIAPPASRETLALGASLAQEVSHLAPSLPIPHVDLALAPKTAACVAGLIGQGLVRSAHDCSEGGLLVAIAEMLIGAQGDARIGCDLTSHALSSSHADAFAHAFSEGPTRYLLEVSPADAPRVHQAALASGLEATHVATLTPAAHLSWRIGSESQQVSVDALTKAWRGTLDW